MKNDHVWMLLSKVTLLLQAITATVAYTPFSNSLFLSRYSEGGVPVDASSSKLPFTVVQVDSRDLYYGILVFRHGYQRLDDFQAQHNHLSRMDSLLELTKTKCDENGQDIWFSGGERGLLTQFAAIRKNEKGHNDHLDITNSVIGAADIHLRSFERDTLLQMEIEVKNVRVDPSFRRQGVATRLMEKIQNHVREHYPSAQVYLDTDVDNFAARALYQTKGFKDDPTEIGKMIWKIDDDSSLS